MAVGSVTVTTVSFPMGFLGLFWTVGSSVLFPFLIFWWSGVSLLLRCKALIQIYIEDGGERWWWGSFSGGGPD